MSKDINIKMNTKSINDAIKELQRLESDFVRKLDLFVRMLTNDSVQIALLAIRESVGSDNNDASISYAVSTNGDIKYAQIQMTGTDALFIEFGAGYYYNPTDPPHASEHGMGVGTYPGQTHAFDVGWWYTDGNGESVYTHGTKATSPMLMARDNYRNNAIKMALQIFRS